MRANISPATLNDHHEVQQFWYRIYVQEMRRHVGDALTNHHEQTLGDPLLNAGSLLLARDDSGRLVGTMLTTLARDHYLGKYEQLYGIERLNEEQRRAASITTKLMVHADFRRSRLSMLMAKMAYEHDLTQGILHDYIDCNDHLVPFFLKLGYQRHLGRIVHRDYGEVNSMVINLRDHEHLQQLNSPFYRSLLAAEQREESAHAAA